MFSLIVAGIIMFILSIASPFFGLLNYMGILYLRPMQVYPQLVMFPLAKIFAIATIFGFLLKLAKGQKIFFNFKQDKILVALLAVIVLSFSVGWIPRCLETLDQMVKNVIVYGLIVGIVVTQKRLKIFIWALLIFSAILAFDTVQALRAIDVQSLDAGRLGGFSGAYFGNSGDFAVMMTVVLPFAFFLGLAGRPILLRPIAFYLIFLFVAAIVASRARGGLLALGTIMLGIGYFGVKSPQMLRKIISILLVVITIIGIVVFSPTVFKERASTILKYQEEATAQSRIEYWKIGVKMFLSNPLLGVGAGNYQIRYHDFGGWGKVWVVPHNMYIDVLSGMGGLGFGCFFFLLYLTFKESMATYRALRKYKKTKSFVFAANQAAILSLAAYCVGGMFLSIFVYPILYIIIGLNVSVNNIANKTLLTSKVV